MLAKNFSLFAQKERQTNRIFAGSVLEKPLRVRDGASIQLILSNECTTEKSVFDLLTGVGFDIQMVGTKYLLNIIINCVNKVYIPEKTSDYYEIARQKYGGRIKIIENAIIRAIESIKLSNFLEINKIFKCTVFHKDMPISAGSFLSSVCGRLVMLKCHEKGKTYFV